jgi:hypothetical protein
MKKNPFRTVGKIAKPAVKQNPTFVLTDKYKETVRASSYIGKKGYTVPKVSIDPADYEFLKKDLFMIPFTMGPKYGNEPESSFPVYRENAAKMYLPRFYGISRYGLPDRSELAEGEDIDIDFVKELRDYQTNIVNVYMDYVLPQAAATAAATATATSKGNGGILEVPCGKGKCLAKGTPILMFDGTIKKVEHVRVGDVLMGDDMQQRNVLSLARGRELMYKISEVGTDRSYTVNKSHILTLADTNIQSVIDISVTDYLHLDKNNNSQLNNSHLRGIRIQNPFYPMMYKILVTPVGIGEYYGFTIDGNRRFVLGDYTITHNTVMALKIISILKKKTLILVHKEFLMNQWIERITEFMPSARVGKIQGPVFDVEGNDIVIGMIQTMHSRDFPSEAFAPFGLTVIDEVHRIGSEEFSKTLFKAVTPYMLGISATVERKDRLTKVLYMFIGNKIYSEERSGDDMVHVRAIQFKSNDSEFNETEYDFRGSPKYSTMITKLCQFGPRSDFIVLVISDLIKEHPEKQIMVLAHNRELLTYLYDAIRHKISNDENTVGYYVGGMKEKDLKITEGRRIVLATYAMAAEALDIKSLSTLVMATPKTDIEQSVGRILRAKGQNPIVVDIVDTHEYLKRQFNTRRIFYKKCNYKIMSIGSDAYRGFQIDWLKDKTWRTEYVPTNAIAEASVPRKCMINIPKEILDAEPV